MTNRWRRFVWLSIGIDYQYQSIDILVSIGCRLTETELTHKKHNFVRSKCKHISFYCQLESNTVSVFPPLFVCSERTRIALKIWPPSPPVAVHIKLVTWYQFPPFPFFWLSTSCLIRKASISGDIRPTEDCGRSSQRSIRLKIMAVRTIESVPCVVWWAEV